MPGNSSKKTTTIIVVILLIVVGAVVLFMRSHKEVVQEPVPVVVEKPTGPIKEKIGTSVEGRAIESFTYGEGSTELVFVGGVHGGYEWNSVLLAYTFMDYLSLHPEIIPPNIKITVVPSANPDGVFKVLGKEGRFTLADAPKVADTTGMGRFNAHEVDLNRNFDCKWQPTSTWRSKKVSAGTKAFSEPEAQAIRDLALSRKPAAFVFWHSQSNAVYASECMSGILPETRAIMKAYATAAQYPAVDSFDAYPVTGDAEGWLASVKIPAITVELKTHETIEWDRNLLGIKALLMHFKELQ
jgi:hypothetical protein